MRSSEFSGGDPIGAQRLFTDMGVTITLGDKSVWLRAGSFASLGTYPRLAAMDAYRALGRASTTKLPATTGSGHGVFQLASNGAGTLVCNTGGGGAGGAPYYSTDGGLTWTLATGWSLNTSEYVADITYGNGRFVALIGHTGASTVRCYYSVAGLAWTSGNTVATAAAGISGVTGVLIWTGNKFTGVVPNGTGVERLTTTDGVTLTNVGSTGVASGSQSSAWRGISDGVSKSILWQTGAAYGNYSSDSGTTYANKYTAGNNCNFGFSAGGGVVCSIFGAYSDGRFLYWSDHTKFNTSVAPESLRLFPTKTASAGILVCTGARSFLFSDSALHEIGEGGSPMPALQTLFGAPPAMSSSDVMGTFPAANGPALISSSLAPSSASWCGIGSSGLPTAAVTGTSLVSYVKVAG